MWPLASGIPSGAIDGLKLAQPGLSVLTAYNALGDHLEQFNTAAELNEGDALIPYVHDAGHDGLGASAIQNAIERFYE